MERPWLAARFPGRCGQGTAGEVAQALAEMNESGHPDAARLARSVASITGLRVPDEQHKEMLEWHG
jgi:hypothetical protein